MRTIHYIFILILITLAGSLAAQEETTTAEESTTTAVTTTAPAAKLDSNETRERFGEVLRRYPPEVSKVLKLDPALFGNPTYLSTYPELASFVGEHPEIAHNPAFYLEGVWIPNDLPVESAGERIWRDLMQGISIFLVMLLITSTLVWLIRTLIEHRRWSRLTRTQAEVHGKLMDRLSSNEELLAYMQTTGGKRFLESAPIAVSSEPRAVSAPISRMLWSVQVGLILAAAGVGLTFVSNGVDKVVSQPLSAMGVLAMAIGAGFLLSAVVSFFLSRRLGLFPNDAAAAE
jgi:hypothetical protein